jgi:hypothetical protein
MWAFGLFFVVGRIGFLFFVVCVDHEALTDLLMMVRVMCQPCTGYGYCGCGVSTCVCVGREFVLKILCLLC